MSKTRILIVAGRKLFREGIASLLAEDASLRIVGEADEAAAAAKLIDALDVDVILLSLSRPQSYSKEARALASAFPRRRLLVLGHHFTHSEIRNLLTAGVAGCLTKDCSSKELLDAIHVAMSGRRFLGPSLTETMVHGMVDPPRAGLGSLAPREQEVLRRIALGNSTKEIASALELSAKTIETHRRRIMRKLGRHSVAELTQYAIREELIDLVP